MMKDFLKFSKRLELSEKIDSYITENGIRMDAFGVITTLSSMGLLDVEACKKYLDGEGETETEMDKRFKEELEKLERFRNKVIDIFDCPIDTDMDVFREIERLQYMAAATCSTPPDNILKQLKKGG